LTRKVCLELVLGFIYMGEVCWRQLTIVYKGAEELKLQATVA